MQIQAYSRGEWNDNMEIGNQNINATVQYSFYKAFQMQSAHVSQQTDPVYATLHLFNNYFQTEIVSVQSKPSTSYVFNGRCCSGQALMLHRMSIPCKFDLVFVLFQPQLLLNKMENAWSTELYSHAYSARHKVCNRSE